MPVSATRLAHGPSGRWGHVRMRVRSHQPGGVLRDALSALSAHERRAHHFGVDVVGLACPRRGHAKPRERPLGI